MRVNLAVGLWFPWLESGLQAIFERLPGTRINNRLGGVPGASELYLALTILFATLWLSVVNRSPHPFFAAPFLSRLASLVPLLRATEILLFSLHWVFVATGKLEAIRRSLACFLLNLVEIAILFSLMRLLSGCATGSALETFLQSAYNVFALELAPHASGYSWCGFLAYYQWIIGGLLLTIAIASLVGGVLREEKPRDR